MFVICFTILAYFIGFSLEEILTTSTANNSNNSAKPIVLWHGMGEYKIKFNHISFWDKRVATVKTQELRNSKH